MSAEISTKQSPSPLAEDLSKLSVPSRPEPKAAMPSHALNRSERSTQELSRGIRAGRQLVEGLSRLVQNSQDLSGLPYNFEKGYRELAATLRVDATLLSRAAVDSPARADEFRPAAAERALQANAVQSLGTKFGEQKEHFVTDESAAKRSQSR